MAHSSFITSLASKRWVLMGNMRSRQSTWFQLVIMKRAWKMHFSTPSQWNEMCFVHQRIIFQGEKGQHFLALAEEEEDIWKGVAEGWLTRCLSKQTKYKFRKSSDSCCHAIQMFSTFQWQRSEHCCKLVPIMSKNQSLMGLMTAIGEPAKWRCEFKMRSRFPPNWLLSLFTMTCSSSLHNVKWDQLCYLTKW